MKKLSIITYQLSILALVTFFSSCKEVGPNISLKNNQNSVSDTTYMESPVASAEIKNVMIEEFTGVKCANCPEGHAKLRAFKTAHPNRIVSASFHPKNSLGIPYPFSVEVFQNTIAQTLFNYLVQINKEPVAAIDRAPSSLNPGSVLYEPNYWEGKVNEQLAKTTPVNLKISKTYNPVNRELTIVTELHYTQNVPTENKLTLLLIESNIVSAQLNGAIVDTFYTHNDVERAFVSAIQGDPIAQPLDAGRVVIKIYKTTIAENWKPENMKIVAYVHEFLNDVKTVYQAREIEVMP